jgi:predicted DNA binding protein
MNTIIQITKSQEVLPFEKVWQIFKNAKSIEEIKQAVEVAQDRLYLTWSTVDVTDKDGERIPIEDAIKQQVVMLERGGTIADEHSNAVVGKTIDYRVMTHPKVNKLGILQLNKIFNHNEKDNIVWEEIKSGKRTGMSVGGFNAEGFTFDIDDKSDMVKVIQGFRQYETSSVYSPANPYATHEAVSAIAKSDKTGVISDKYIVQDNEVYKIVKQGVLVDAITKSCDDEQEIKKENVKNEKKEEYKVGDEPMVENVNKTDALGVAISKVTKGEPLSEEEKALVKQMYEDKEKDKKTEKTTPAERENLEAETSGTQPVAPAPEIVNEPDVAKSEQIAKMVEVQVAKEVEKFAQQMQKTQKSASTPVVASTPKITKTEGTEMSEIKKSSVLYGDNIIALACGKIKKSWAEVHKDFDEVVKSYGGAQ